MPENSTETALKSRRRGPGRPFKKGESGNPGGRPKGLAERARELTNGGDELAEFMVQVFRGEHGARLKDRMDAASWLSDRGFGRPTQQLQHEGSLQHYSFTMNIGGDSDDDADK